MCKSKHKRCTNHTTSLARGPYGNKQNLDSTIVADANNAGNIKLCAAVVLSPQRDDHPGAIARRRNDAVAAVARLGEIIFSELSEEALCRFCLDQRHRAPPLEYKR